ncbi:MAG: response regulator transcription factor [Myxococcales bacterium]
MERRILIVEDDPDTRESYADYLRAAGFEVEVAVDGMDALFKSKAAPPSLVVLDLGLPKLDGIYVADLWRRDPAMAQVPVIAVSGFFDSHNEARARDAGCTLTLAKPISPDMLKAEIEKLLLITS